MKYLRITLLTVFVLATAGCDDLSDRIDYYFNSGGALRDSASVPGEETSEGAILVITTLD
jgi:hypothetical protein